MVLNTVAQQNEAIIKIDKTVKPRPRSVPISAITISENIPSKYRREQISNDRKMEKYAIAEKNMQLSNNRVIFFALSAFK